MCKFVLLKYLMRQNCRKHFMNNVLLVSPHSQSTITYSVRCYFSTPWWGKNETASKGMLFSTGTLWGAVSSCGQRSPCREQPIRSLSLTLTSCRHPSEWTTSPRYSAEGSNWAAPGVQTSGEVGTVTGGATVGSNIQQWGVETQRIDW